MHVSDSLCPLSVALPEYMLLSNGLGKFPVEWKGAKRDTGKKRIFAFDFVCELCEKELPSIKILLISSCARSEW